MNSYQNTIIYKLACKDPTITDIYVGHTTDFIKRKQCHKYSCNNENDKRYNYLVYQFIRENGGFNNWEMIQIELYPCNDANEATSRERHWLETLHATLNINTPSRTAQEWREKYNAYMKEYNKKTYDANKYHIRRIKNTKNLLKKYYVSNEIKNYFGEYLYDAKTMLDIIQQMPSHMVVKILEDITNDDLFTLIPSSLENEK